MAAAAATTTLSDPARWGMAAGTVAEVAERLRGLWGRYRTCFRTHTGDTSETAWVYLRGVFPVDQERTFAAIARREHGPEAAGQRVPHCMSQSPWSARALQESGRAEVAATP